MKLAKKLGLGLLPLLLVTLFFSTLHNSSTVNAAPNIFCVVADVNPVVKQENNTTLLVTCPNGPPTVNNAGGVDVQVRCSDGGNPRTTVTAGNLRVICDGGVESFLFGSDVDGEDDGLGANDPSDEGENSEVDNSCESKGITMGWILCPTVSLIDGTLNWVDTQVQRLLEVDQEKYAHESLRTAWAQFRNIAYIILIPMMLVMVIGTALGFEVFSAYTVKRALPRMAIAVIFITLSWYICQFLIGFFNVAGAGVSGLVTYPFREIMPEACQVPNSDGISKGITLSCLFDVPTVTGGGVSGAAGGALHSIFLITLQWPALILGTVVMLIFFGLPLLLSIVIAFLVLLARQLFIIALVLVAPLAILAWIFPGNDKIWKSWWSIFSKLLMMFPLIMLLLAVGKVFAILLNEGSGGALDGAILNPILKLLAYMLPYALIPLTFKFAGGMFATITGMVNDRSRGMFDRLRKRRAEKFQRGLGGHLFKGGNENNLRGKFNKAFGAGATVATGQAGLDARKWRGRVGNTLSTTSINQAHAMMEDDDYTSWKGYDQLNRSAAMSTDERSLRRIMEASREYHTKTVDANGNEIWIQTAEDKANMERDVAKVENMRRKYGNAAMRQAAFISAMGGGTALDVVQKNGQTYNAWELAASIAGSDRAIQAELVAKGRSAAGQAGRIDHAGISFGDGIGEIERFLNVTDPSTLDGVRQESAKHTRRQVRIRQGAGALVHPGQKTSAVENLAPGLREDADKAFDAAAAPGAGDKELTDFVSHLASMKAVYDNMGSTNRDKQRILRDQVTSQELDVGKMTDKMREMFASAIVVTNPDGTVSSKRKITYSEALQAIENDGLFQQFRKEFADQFKTQAAAAAAVQAATQVGGQLPQGPQAGPPPTGPQP